MFDEYFMSQGLSLTVCLLKKMVMIGAWQAVALRCSARLAGHGCLSCINARMTRLTTGLPTSYMLPSIEGPASPPHTTAKRRPPPVQPSAGLLVLLRLPARACAGRAETGSPPHQTSDKGAAFAG